MKKVLLFIVGLVTGVVLTVLVFVLIGSNQSKESSNFKEYDTPVSYENKKVAEFRVIQVTSDGALAAEKDDDNSRLYLGKTVFLVGEGYYSEQIVTIENPMQIGTLSYQANSGMPMTVPVIE